MRFQFRVNQQEVQLRLRPRENATREAVVVDPEVGEFALDGTESLEARDVNLAAALLPQQRDGGWKKITTAQAVTMLMGINGKTEETDKESRAEDSRRR
jgi:hypothetical protein